jgi:DNA-binding transcriptional MerR regulator
MTIAATTLFQARELARLSGVTVRTLHHYDRVGLLKPSRYTEAGYRLYGERDFVRLQQIVMLKFIGLSLKEIKGLLSQRELDLQMTLRLQREIVEARRLHLDTVIQAIERAEQAMASSDQPDWETFRQIVEVINMQNDMEWMKRYYTDEQLAELAERGTPEVLERGQRDWAALIKEVEAAISEGVDPKSEKAQTLAARWVSLIEAFTGGNPAIRESLTKLYADQANWPSTFRKPFPDDVGAFIAQAGAACNKE